MLSQSLIQSEISEVENKINSLDLIREQLERDLLKIHEDELELDAERMSTLASLVSVTLPHISPRHPGTLGIRRSNLETSQSSYPSSPPHPTFAAEKRHLSPTLALSLTSHPVLGPVFLPSEHDDLPPAIAFMVPCTILCSIPSLTHHPRPWKTIRRQ